MSVNLNDLMTVDLPEVFADGVHLEKFEVTKPEADRANFRSFFDSGRGSITAGTYTRLMIDGKLWMSDTPDEKRDHWEPLWEAQRRGGRVLVNGLGMGMVVGALLKMPNVEHVDVVEIDPRIVQHIGPLYESERCTIHEDNALTKTWPVGTRWTVVWSDIWPEITGDNMPDMHRLARMYGRRADWHGSWCRRLAERQW